MVWHIHYVIKQLSVKHCARRVLCVSNAHRQQCRPLRLALCSLIRRVGS